MEQVMPLHQFTIVGNRFRGEAEKAAFAAAVPDQPIRLEFEPDNPHDPKAIKVWLSDPNGGEAAFVGYVPRTENEEVGRLLRQYPDAKCGMYVVPPKAYIEIPDEAEDEEEEEEEEDGEADEDDEERGGTFQANPAVTFLDQD
jgi:hypothetical protein